jgi:hypothetical protein
MPRPPGPPVSFGRVHALCPYLYVTYDSIKRCNHALVFVVAGQPSESTRLPGTSVNCPFAPSNTRRALCEEAPSVIVAQRHTSAALAKRSSLSASTIVQGNHTASSTH